MKGLGGLFLFFGVGSIVLDGFGYEFVIMSWIHNWGVETAWLIIKATIGFGIFLFVIGLFVDNKIVEGAREQRRSDRLRELGQHMPPQSDSLTEKELSDLKGL